MKDRKGSFATCALAAFAILSNGPAAARDSVIPDDFFLDVPREETASQTGFGLRHEIAGVAVMLHAKGLRIDRGRSSLDLGDAADNSMSFRNDETAVDLGEKSDLGIAPAFRFQLAF